MLEDNKSNYELNKNRQALLDKANMLPLTPGVYIMKDKNGKIIYVGKSSKLKNRVSQYFGGGAKAVKTEKMVSSVRDFDYILCQSEIEALSLENSLIKQYTPRYNIKLKDAKSYPYIKITGGDYPRIEFTRTRAADSATGARYFGPYSGSSTAYSIINVVLKTLGLPDCKRKFPKDIGKERPCLYYQMGRCVGVCTGNVDKDEYALLIASAAEILRGNAGKAVRELKEQMNICAAEERYEAAARFRDRIFALEKLNEKQQMVAAPDDEHDVIAMYSDEFCTCITVFYVRGGALADHNDFLFPPEQIADDSGIASFICEHYLRRDYIPPKILLAFELEDVETGLIGEYLSGKAGRKITIKTPVRGDLNMLCKTASANAAQKAEDYREKLKSDDEKLYALAKTLHLETVPERIEAYDISNIGSEHKTAGMIVCENGDFKKRDYRTFVMKTVEGTDDYACMTEAINRRTDHLCDTEGSFSRRPDLILLDGGTTHVSVIRKLLAKKGIDIPVFGMVKDEFHKTRELCGDNDSEYINIARDRRLFAFIYGIQEEVHRYTFSRTDAAKRKTLKTSSLEKIDGIGPKKAEALLRHFGSLAKIRTAGKEELCAVRGISAHNATAIIIHFSDKK